MHARKVSDRCSHDIRALPPYYGGIGLQSPKLKEPQWWMSLDPRRMVDSLESMERDLVLRICASRSEHMDSVPMR